MYDMFGILLLMVGSPVIEVHPGTCLTAVFEGEQTHHYRMTAETDSIVHGRLVQRGTDVATELVVGNHSRMVDTSSGTVGSEPFWVLLEAGDVLELKVRSLTSRPHGDYQLHISHGTTPTETRYLAVAADLLAATGKPSRLDEELAMRLEVGDTRDSVGCLARFVEHLLSHRHYGNAISLIEKHRDLVRQEYPWNHILAAQLALAQRLSGHPEQAIQAYKEAHDIAQSMGHLQFAGLAANDLGYLQFILGNTYEALAWFQRAQVHYAYCACAPQAAKTRLNEAEVYNFLGQMDDAQNTILMTLPQLRAVSPKSDLALALMQLGWSMYLQGDSAKALAYFEEAIDLDRELDHPYQLAGALDRAGSALRSLGHYEEALARHSEAMALFASGGHKLDVAQSRANLALDYFAKGEVDRAAQHTAAVLPIFRRERPNHMSTLLALAARISSEQHRPAEAVAYYEEALHVIDELYQGAESRGLRRSLSDSRYQILAEFAHLLVEEGQTERAFAMLDGRRARILLQRLISARPKRKEPFEGGSPWKPKPGGALEKAARTVPDLTSLARNWLDADTLVLSYVLGESESLLFALDKQGLSVYELPAKSELEKLAEQTVQAAKSGHLARGQGVWQRRSDQLSHMLLSPVADKMTSRRLVLIPDGTLHYVPFAALAHPSRPGSVIDHHETVFLPSLSLGYALDQIGRSRGRAPNTLLAFADPVYNPDDPRLLGKPGETIESLRRLSARDTAEVDANSLHLVTGLQATRTRFLETRWTDYRYLHLSGHGHLDPYPELTGLELSRFDAQGARLQGRLQTTDLFDLHLPLELATLSACSTFAGEDRAGEGMWSLTTAFLEAGALRVIASQWDVREKATAQLFRHFYKNLLEDGLAPSEALRRAQLTLRGQEPWTAPYYWAGWVMQGVWP